MPCFGARSGKKRGGSLRQGIIALVTLSMLSSVGLADRRVPGDQAAAKAEEADPLNDINL